MGTAETFIGYVVFGVSLATPVWLVVRWNAKGLLCGILTIWLLPLAYFIAFPQPEPSKIQPRELWCVGGLMFGVIYCVPL